MVVEDGNEEGEGDEEARAEHAIGETVGGVEVVDVCVDGRVIEVIFKVPEESLFVGIHREVAVEGQRMEI